ncbi:uncharacterized protein F4807DRAFT_459494 [Annulohypoxylon truncatum]|uniref:uncharacterized protein n=1 Tax=Annulohypoxylon truncatum TaxID=327061 RepID=UPI002007DE74|nr:uncharacterized protein F4807DRAFT_459494 [Annulohypoxylon truncatum]KAI1210654.1 hypothetical protein F4807DRAFT_459494 [Annulohypoxylon truncatum]
MGRPTDARQQSGSNRQSVVAKQDPYRQNLAKQHRHKSQPFDPDDLRRRLYIVIAEQEAAKEKRKRRERLAEAGSASTQSKDNDTPISRPASTKPGPNESSFTARVTRRKSMASDPAPPPKESGTQPPEPKTGRSMSKSIQDKLRRKSIMKAEQQPSTSTVENTAPAQTQTQTQTQASVPTYHHVPRSAAAQFERTTTANSMRERNLAHSISQACLKHKDRASPDPTQQQQHQQQQQSRAAALERAPSNSHINREKPHFQNPFQNGRPASSSSRSEQQQLEEVAPHFRRHSVIGLTQVKARRRSSAIGNIAEDETMQTFTVGMGMGMHPAPAEMPVDEISSEETLAGVPVDAATAAEHRVDWTQSDEAQAAQAAAYGKTRAMSSRIPLLKKADSLWTLKGRLGGGGGGGGGRNNSIATTGTGAGTGGKGVQSGLDKMGGVFRGEKGQQQHQQHQEEGGFASTTPKFLRFGFLTKFKR